jgi:DNA-binding transcriptional ArsR family regulator
MTDRVITEVDDLKAVTHPLRVRMLGALREHGPATATELAHRFGTDTGSTSYHLRVLARYGYVEQTPEQRNGRERRWQAAHPTTSWDNEAMAASAEGRAAVAAMRRHQVAALVRAIEGYEAAEGDLPEWVSAAGMSDLIVRLSPAGLTELERRIMAAVEELTAADADDPAARPVWLLAGGFPRVDDPPGHESGGEPAADADADAGAGDGDGDGDGDRVGGAR